jgi:preprotein translocase subunit SecD
MRGAILMLVAAAVVAFATPAGAKDGTHTIELRPVLDQFADTGSGEAGCDGCAVLPLAKPTVGYGRLLVGPTRIDGDGIERVRPRFANQWVIVFELTPSALKDFNELAVRSFGKASPHDQVAIVVDGVVVSNPAFQTTHYDGSVQISGNFSRKEITRLLAKIKSACDC